MFKDALRVLACATALSLSFNASADWCRGSPEMTKNFETARAHERAGRALEAAEHYSRVVHDECAGPKTLGDDAARYLAPLALSLAKTAEGKGDLEQAYRWYEEGGHFAAADRAMLSLLRAKLRANPDDLAAYTRASEHFKTHTDGAFAANNRARLAITGSYQPDARLMAEVENLPAPAVERNLQREAKVFTEDYVRDVETQYVSNKKAEAAARADMASATSLDAKMRAANQAGQQGVASQKAFAAKWPEDRIKSSLETLALARSWAGWIKDKSRQSQLLAQIQERASERANISLRHPGAPALLQAAIGYYSADRQEANVANVKSRANTLGEDAERREDYQLAEEYYEVAGAIQKREKVREARARIQNEENKRNAKAGKKQAEDMKREMMKVYGDPQQVEAMRRQALEMKRSMQNSSAQSQDFKKGADDLERELAK